MGSAVLTSQSAVKIEETMETGLILLMDHGTYSTRKHKTFDTEHFHRLSYFCSFLKHNS